jgi:hypothetical protein
MWGYGWLLALVPVPKIWVVLQVFVSVGSAAMLLRALEEQGHLRGSAARWTRVGLVIFIPWYGGMCVPYSAPTFAAALVTGSLALLVCGHAHRFATRCSVALPALLFGSALNFRSDYLALATVVGLYIVLRSRSWARGLQRGCLWLIVCLAALVPWALYTHAAAGRMLLGSTNAGHVLFLGWGDLPDNPWGITVSDGDPVMLGEVAQHVGPSVSTLSVAGDLYLRQRFVAMVREQPTAYARRVVRHAGALVMGGFYPGVWDEGFRTRVRGRFPSASLQELVTRHSSEVLALATPRTTVQFLAEAQARLALLLTATLAVVGARIAWRRRDWVVGLLLLGIAFQTAVSLSAHYIRPPLNNQIVPLFAVAAWVLSTRRAGCPSAAHER